METTTHAAFIMTAYAAAIVVVGGLITWILLDYRMQRRTLSNLEMRGVARRSERAKEKV